MIDTEREVKFWLTHTKYGSESHPVQPKMISFVYINFKPYLSPWTIVFNQCWLSWCKKRLESMSPLFCTSLNFSHSENEKMIVYCSHKCPASQLWLLQAWTSPLLPCWSSQGGPCQGPCDTETLCGPGASECSCAVCWGECANSSTPKGPSCPSAASDWIFSASTYSSLSRLESESLHNEFLSKMNACNNKCTFAHSIIHMPRGKIMGKAIYKIIIRQVIKCILLFLLLHP